MLILTGLIIAGRCTAQCDFPVRLTASPGYCPGTTLKVSSQHALASIVWYDGNTPVKTVDDTTQRGALTEAADGLPLPDALSWPMGLAVNDSGSIYVTDIHGGRVVRWSPGSTSWVTVAGGNGQGADADQLGSPTSLALDQAGNLYVADANERVQKWVPGATSGVTVAGGNGHGSAANQLSGELMIALDCDDNLYIADNDRIQRWAPGATSGVTVAGGNGQGNAANQISDPVSIWVDGSKNIYVLDAGNSRVQKWAPGETSGVTVAGGNGAGTAANQLNGPMGLFVDNNANVYVVDAYSVTGGTSFRIRKWAPGATEGIIVASHDMYSIFWGSIGVFVDSKGTIYGGTTLNTNILLQLSQPSTIDDAFTPTTGGLYHAVVTDVNGYISTTDTIPIYPPPAGPPSIRISASATDVYLCEQVTFTASVTNEGAAPLYQWQVSGVNAGSDSTAYSNNLFANGDQVQCIMTTVGTSCQLVQDTSNVIILSVDAQGHATVSIDASDSVVCGTTPITFTATVTNGSGMPVFEWMVNGQPAGDSTAVFVDSVIGSEVVYCLITSDASCGLAKSNSIPVFIYPIPVIAAGQVYTIPYGQRLTLNPAISGDVTSYLWVPGAGLSDSTIRDPVADPKTSTTYTLQVQTPGGCQAKGIITVDVYTPLSIPNAFTPNGDGHNDRLYVLGGPEGSSIRGFAVFDRWGQRIFHVENALPGDAQYGWDGNIGGRAAPSGTYVYMIVMKLPGGREQSYKGTVELIR